MSENEASWLQFHEERNTAKSYFFERNVISDNLKYQMPVLKHKSLTGPFTGEMYSIGKRGSAMQ